MAVSADFRKTHFPETLPARVLCLGKCAVPFAEKARLEFPEADVFAYSTLPEVPFPDGNARVVFGTHPLPSEGNVTVSRELEAWLEKGSGPLAAFVSGGTSSLLSLPPRGWSLEETVAVERRLLDCGASIEEVNAARMALSELRGGGVASLVKPWPFKAFVWCDVPPRLFRMVGSAPMGGVGTDIKGAAEAVLRRYGVRAPRKLPVKAGARVPAGCSISRLGDGASLARGILKELAGAGTRARFLGMEEGTPPERAAAAILEASKKAGRPSVLLGNGEFPVKVGKEGRGGRCSHLALEVALGFSGEKRWCFGAIATDGEDGNAGGGAIVSDNCGLSASDIRDALGNFDSGTLLGSAGLLIPREPTRNNLRDLWFLTLEE